MNVDWDEALDEADRSPRSILAEMLARADEIKDVIIIANFTDGSQETYQSVESQAMSIGMLELTKLNVLMDVKEQS